VPGDTPHVCKAPSVRKQYHFWPAEVGFDAWDVDRLIELSGDLPVERVRLAWRRSMRSTASIDSVDQRRSQRYERWLSTSA
jgi:hypothetical protein